MKRIDREYDRVRNLSKERDEDFLMSRKHKDDREIHILGAFTELLRMGNQSVPRYFQKFDPPDFHLYNSDKTFFKQLEVVENMHWGRKRGDENRIPFDENKYLIDSNRCQIRLWYSFIKNLNKKFSKHYGNDSWLLVYHNISVFHISNIGFWFNIIFNMKHEVEKRGLVSFSNSPFEKIFVLNSGFTELVEIHPEEKVVFSKYARFVTPTK